MGIKEAMELMREAEELTDLPGHSKLCGSVVESEDHPLHGGPGDPPLFFCSASCLYEAEHIFDELPTEKLEKVRELIDIAEAESSTKQ
jgi:hypothetical protein